MTISTSSARTIAVDVLDNMSIVGGVVAGTAVGRFAHARTTERNGPTSRLAAGVAAGLVAAVITDTLLAAATGSWRRTLNGTAPAAAPATSLDQARPRIAAQAAADAQFKARTHWHWNDAHTPLQNDLWHGYEDGTAIHYLTPGLYLRYQPSHHELGTSRSVGWTQQYTLESGQGTTVVPGPARLLELLDTFQEQAEPGTVGDVAAGERPELLTAIVDAALAEQPEDDLTCPAVTGEDIQLRAAHAGISDVTHTEAVDLINERLSLSRTRVTSGGQDQEADDHARNSDQEDDPEGRADHDTQAMEAVRR
ncbi:hypothetical protein ACIRU8_44880 [Streptomyces sp. NPDC101175]|uniref:hypothetical protein n=1 Tax=Streptomyces sp. NPDC101175 TaxID=3366123 RepID=UPI003834C735